MAYTPIQDMIGQTFAEVMTTEEEMIFRSNTKTVTFYHGQDCCETVVIDDITGNLNDLVNTPLLMAEESSEVDQNNDGSQTWTFYRFRTIKGSVTVKWHGESNGYYSESVDWRVEENNPPLDIEPKEVAPTKIDLLSRFTDYLNDDQ